MLPKATPQPAPAPPPRRIGVGNIVRAAKKQPMRILLHGVEKIGKTSFAAGAPGVIFLCPEEGLPPALAETPHFDAPAGGWRWQDVLDAVRALAIEEHPHQTLVLDTLDWIEPLIWQALCERNRWDSIEAPGYGKGYTAALDEWRKLVAELEQLRRARGMHVILLAHSWIRPFKDPESEGWDRYELKVHKAAAGVWKEWVDAVLFAKHDQVAAKDQRTKRVRGISTGTRLIYTVHNAAYDAGNRYDLPDTLPLDWQSFADAVAAHRPADPVQLLAAIEALLAGTGAEAALVAAGKSSAAVRAAADKFKSDAATLAKLHNQLAAIVGGTSHTKESTP